jgi:hypothetical protein
MTSWYENRMDFIDEGEIALPERLASLAKLKSKQPTILQVIESFIQLFIL